MNILYHCTFSNQDDFLKLLKKKIKPHKIFTLDDNIQLDKIEAALVWNLPNKILKKLSNLISSLRVKILWDLNFFFNEVKNSSWFEKVQ